MMKNKICDHFNIIFHLEVCASFSTRFMDKTLTNSLVGGEQKWKYRHLQVNH